MANRPAIALDLDAVAPGPRADYEAGIVELRKGVSKRGKGSDRHRIRVARYDYPI